MTNFEGALRSAALAVLRRELTDEERIEFLELAGAIGMNSVQDYLYMLMVFKRNEDRVSGLLDSFRGEIREKFEEIGELERKIDATLEGSIHAVLRDGAEKIGRSMGGDIAREARELLTAHEMFHFERGQVFIAGTVFAIAVTTFIFGSYWGAGAKNTDFLYFWLQFRAGHVALFCGVVYVGFWAIDRWKLLKRGWGDKVWLALHVSVLAALFVFLLNAA